MAFEMCARNGVENVYRTWTAREWLAAMAMGGILSDWNGPPWPDDQENANIAFACFRLADAMLAESARREQEGGAE